MKKKTVFSISWIVERLGIVVIEENMLNLLGKDCSAHIYSRSDFSSFQWHYYVPTREPIRATAVANAFPVILLVRIMLQVLSFPTDLYARDQFGARSAVILCLLGMLKTILEGYHPVYILPPWPSNRMVFMLEKFCCDVEKYKNTIWFHLCVHLFNVPHVSALSESG